MRTGEMGQIELLAKLLSQIEDPDGTGVGVDVESAGVGIVHMPNGDRYRVSIEWLGDRELEPFAYVLFTNENRTELARCWPVEANGSEDPSIAEWKVERASRESPSHSWGPPETRGITGTLENLTRHYTTRGLSRRELVP